MNQDNLKFLKDRLTSLGFGDRLHADLEKAIQQQPAEFKLTLNGEFNNNGVKEKVDYSLDFRKSDQTDMYFLNRYQATLKNEKPELDRTQTFYLTKNSGITAKEAFNLLSGRAVNRDLTNKEGQPYNAWLQLDFKEKDTNQNYKLKQFTQGYGYDLEAVLNQYPIKELGKDTEKADLMKSLEKGNVQKVSFVVDGVEKTMHIEANPQYKAVKLYDANMRLQYQGADRDKKQSQESSEKKEKSVKQDVDDEGETRQGEKKSKRKGVRV